MRKIHEDRRVLNVDGREIALRVRRNPRARRLSLRVDTIEGEAVLTVPPSTSVIEGIRFAERKSGWLANRLDKVPPRVPFVDGSTVSILDQEYVVRHAPMRAGWSGARAGKSWFRGASNIWPAA